MIKSGLDLRRLLDHFDDVEKILAGVVIPAPFSGMKSRSFRCEPTAPTILMDGAVAVCDPHAPAPSIRIESWMMNKKTILISQLLMTFMMAASMSGIMSLIAMGPTAEWLVAWPGQFASAWPIAFVLTMVTWPLAMAITGFLVRSEEGSRHS